MCALKRILWKARRTTHRSESQGSVPTRDVQRCSSWVQQASLHHTFLCTREVPAGILQPKWIKTWVFPRTRPLLAPVILSPQCPDAPYNSVLSFHQKHSSKQSTRLRSTRSCTLVSCQLGHPGSVIYNFLVIAYSSENHRWRWCTRKLLVSLVGNNINVAARLFLFEMTNAVISDFPAYPFHQSKQFFYAFWLWEQNFNDSRSSLPRFYFTNSELTDLSSLRSPPSRATRKEDGWKNEGCYHKKRGQGQTFGGAVKTSLQRCTWVLVSTAHLGAVMMAQVVGALVTHRGDLDWFPRSDLAQPEMGALVGSPFLCFSNK